MLDFERKTVIPREQYDMVFERVISDPSIFSGVDKKFRCDECHCYKDVNELELTLAVESALRKRNASPLPFYFCVDCYEDVRLLGIGVLQKVKILRLPRYLQENPEALQANPETLRLMGASFEYPRHLPAHKRNHDEEGFGKYVVDGRFDLKNYLDDIMKQSEDVNRELLGMNSAEREEKLNELRTLESIEMSQRPN